ncbi:MAG: DinB family protein [Planctomycetaceae bacterium]|nr:MAG: DinB family protein [Planctomycetaceae bacterium]
MSVASACQIGPMIADSARLGVAYAQRLLAGIPADRFARLATVDGHAIESNHPAFIFGHLSLYPSRIVSELGADAATIEPSDEYVRWFDHRAACVDDPDGGIYPPMDEITERFFAAHALAIEVLQAADDSRFVVENPNEAMRAKFATIGSMHGFYVGGHLMLHIGQLSAWRRMIGLGPG